MDNRQVDLSEKPQNKGQSDVNAQCSEGNHLSSSSDTHNTNNNAQYLKPLDVGHMQRSSIIQRAERSSYDQIAQEIIALEEWRISNKTWKLQGFPPLGQGQFGVVLRAEWGGTNVAVKALYNSNGGDKEALHQLKLFEKELRAMRELHHPLIIQFLGYFISDDMGLLIFMEYLANGSVESYMQKHRYISLELRRKWADQMTQALIYLHNRKPDALIHRDLKPANSC